MADQVNDIRPNIKALRPEDRFIVKVAHSKLKSSINVKLIQVRMYLALFL